MYSTNYRMLVIILGNTYVDVTINVAKYYYILNEICWLTTYLNLTTVQ